jgi:hypothetical protein
MGVASEWNVRAEGNVPHAPFARELEKLLTVVTAPVTEAGTLLTLLTSKEKYAD